jgi:glycosyltransferase involved in cell wall biosynthesis
MKLLIVSHMGHHINLSNQIVGWGPTVEEINYLAEIFDEVVHVGWFHPGSAPASSLPYAKNNIRLVPVAPSGGNSILEKIKILNKIPSYFGAINREIKNADAIHIRAPASISLLAMVMLAFKHSPVYRWVKYAGNWQPEIPDSWSYRFQRWWLNNNLHRGVVSINGRWVDQARHVYSFHNPCLHEADIVRGRKIGIGKRLTTPINLLFVGNIVTFKGVGRVLQIAEQLKAKQIPFVLDMVGGGPEQQKFEDAALHLKIREQVRFHGWQSKQALVEFYSKAHFIILPSATEGWPKVLSEGMAFGSVPLASAVSSIPQILKESGAGLSFPIEDIRAYAQAIEDFIKNPKAWKKSSEAGINWAHHFTYKTYQKHVCQMFRDAWGIDLLETPKAEKI